MSSLVTSSKKDGKLFGQAVALAWERYKFNCSIDGRCRPARMCKIAGYTLQELNAALTLRFYRWSSDVYLKKNKTIARRKWPVKGYEARAAERKSFLNYLKGCVFAGNAEAVAMAEHGDWVTIHRPTSNGVGWVLLSVDEPDNNFYTCDPALVAFLKKKFLNNGK